MDEKNEKLLEALKLIRAECKKNSDCKRCPLRSSINARTHYCSLLDDVRPDKWRIKGDIEETERLFL